MLFDNFIISKSDVILILLFSPFDEILIILFFLGNLLIKLITNNIGLWINCILKSI